MSLVKQIARYFGTAICVAAVPVTVNGLRDPQLRKYVHVKGNLDPIAILDKEYDTNYQHMTDYTELPIKSKDNKIVFNWEVDKQSEDYYKLRGSDTSLFINTSNIAVVSLATQEQYNNQALKKYINQQDPETTVFNVGQFNADLTTNIIPEYAKEAEIPLDLLAIMTNIDSGKIYDSLEYNDQEARLAEKQILAKTLTDHAKHYWGWDYASSIPIQIASGDGFLGETKDFFRGDTNRFGDNNFNKSYTGRLYVPTYGQTDEPTEAFALAILKDGLDHFPAKLYDKADIIKEARLELQEAKNELINKIEDFIDNFSQELEQLDIFFKVETQDQAWNIIGLERATEDKAMTNEARKQFYDSFSELHNIDISKSLDNPRTKYQLTPKNYNYALLHLKHSYVTKDAEPVIDKVHRLFMDQWDNPLFYEALEQLSGKPDFQQGLDQIRQTRGTVHKKSHEFNAKQMDLYHDLTENGRFADPYFQTKLTAWLMRYCYDVIAEKFSVNPLTGEQTDIKNNDNAKDFMIFMAMNIRAISKNVNYYGKGEEKILIQGADRVATSLNGRADIADDKKLEAFYQAWKFMVENEKPDNPWDLGWFYKTVERNENVKSSPYYDIIQGFGGVGSTKAVEARIAFDTLYDSKGANR
jgi:hypothetical protein